MGPTDSKMDPVIQPNAEAERESFLNTARLARTDPTIHTHSGTQRGVRGGIALEGELEAKSGLHLPEKWAYSCSINGVPVHFGQSIAWIREGDFQQRNVLGLWLCALPNVWYDCIHLHNQVTGPQSRVWKSEGAIFPPRSSGLCYSEPLFHLNEGLLSGLKKCGCNAHMLTICCPLSLVNIIFHSDTYH